MVKNPGRGKVTVLLLLVLGAVLFAGAAYSVRATDQPEFCGSCHVMYEAVRTHQMSAHANLSCNECHAPDAAIPKLIFKTRAGAKDIYQNTFGDVFDVIHVTDNTRQVVNDSCIRCHSTTIRNVSGKISEAKEYCTDCHRSLPHMSRLPISERRVADE
ncbi:cytochrome c3 family protein [Desulfonatronum parangueonense]